MVEALVRELEMQQDYLEGAKVGSIYLGGGTPSLLTSEELDRLFAASSASSYGISIPRDDLHER